MEPLDELPFMPAYDPIYQDENIDKRGILCIRYRPNLGVHTVRVQRDMMDIMDKVGCVFNNPSKVNFYKLGKKLVINQDENSTKYPDMLIYNGKKYEVESCNLICNENFQSLTEAEALMILESAKLHRYKNRFYGVTIEMRDDMNEK